MGLFSRDKSKKPLEAREISLKPPAPSPFSASISDILKETESLQTQGYTQFKSVYNTEFDLFDDMVKLDPELNGAVRAVSLTGNKYSIDYSTAKNQRIRDSVEDFIESIDFDDLIINSMRNLLVYGNSIDKIVGKAGVGITGLQSIPITQITIVDEPLNSPRSPRAYGKDDPIMSAVTYRFREQDRDQKEYPADEIFHLKIDYRSNWFRDRLNRWTYGIWGASRFSALKQAIRAKYNTMNNRIAIEDSMTKQYITIDMKAVEHITDPNEQRERLSHIMNEVAALIESLRADQIPILPDYVRIEQMDMKNVPDNSGFLEMINSDISAVLQVPRVSQGQERGSTFAATFNANTWSVQAISRLQSVVKEGISSLFLKHLELSGIVARRRNLPTLIFEPVDEESPYQLMQRAAMGFEKGILTKEEARKILNYEPSGEGEYNDKKNGDMIKTVRPDKLDTSTVKPENNGENTT